MVYIKAYMWNLERWYWWTYLQGSNGDTDKESRLVDTGVVERVRQTERVAWKYIHYYMKDREAWHAAAHGVAKSWTQLSNWTTTTICKIDNQWELVVWLRELQLVLCDNLEGRDRVGGGREDQEGGDVCIPMSDSCWCMEETNTIL